MRISTKNRLFIEMLILAQNAFDELTAEEIQDQYGSDFYRELGEYLSIAFGLKERGEL